MPSPELLPLPTPCPASPCDFPPPDTIPLSEPSFFPLAVVTLSRGLKSRFSKHRAIARWTLPIWLYVSVTGVLVYVLLYQPTWLI